MSCSSGNRQARAPSAATVRRIAHDIDVDDAAADERVCAWLHAEAMAAAIAGDAPAKRLTGWSRWRWTVKTIRTTCQPDVGGSESTLFSALLHEQAVVIAQMWIPEGTNEITQVKALLAGVDLAGVVVTGDAAHAQHATAAHVACERGGAYALTVQGNQPGLLAQIAAALPPAAPGSEHHVTEDRGTGRIVRRVIWVSPAEGIDFPGAAQVFRIRRDLFDHLGHRLSTEIVHGITSLTVDQATPEQLARLVRQHWTVENKSHWVRDVVYREDHQHAYTGTGAQVMATLRNLALGLLRLARITQITRTCNTSPPTEPGSCPSSQPLPAQTDLEIPLG